MKRVDSGQKLVFSLLSVVPEIGTSTICVGDLEFHNISISKITMKQWEEALQRLLIDTLFSQPT